MSTTSTILGGTYTTCVRRRRKITAVIGLSSTKGLIVAVERSQVINAIFKGTLSETEYQTNKRLIYEYDSTDQRSVELLILAIENKNTKVIEDCIELKWSPLSFSASLDTMKRLFQCCQDFGSKIVAIHIATMMELDKTKALFFADILTPIIVEAIITISTRVDNSDVILGEEVFIRRVFEMNRAIIKHYIHAFDSRFDVIGLIDVASQFVKDDQTFEFILEHIRKLYNDVDCDWLFYVSPLLNPRSIATLLTNPVKGLYINLAPLFVYCDTVANNRDDGQNQSFLAKLILLGVDLSSLLSYDERSKMLTQSVEISNREMIDRTIQNVEEGCKLLVETLIDILGRDLANMVLEYWV